MNVLMIGGVNRLMNQLIRKIKKEGHRVYLLTGSRYSTATYEKVFERYDLGYESEQLSDVFESVNPDVTLFMGAFDSNYRWTNEERELVRLTSGLTNLLTSHTMTSKGRFIFLSSDEIYSKSSPSDLEEDAPASPLQIKGMALAQCEGICANFRRTLEADIVVLRVDHYYTIPRQPDDVNEICANMCLEALRTGNINADGNRHFSLLYEEDAVEFIFKLVRSSGHQHAVYNLSASRELSEMDVARYIQKAMGDNAGITIENKEGEYNRCVLSNRRFDKEFGARIFADTQTTIEKMVKYMVSHKNLFLTGEQENKSPWRQFVDKVKSLSGAIIPYLENLVFFFLVVLISGSALGMEYLKELDLYLLYVLLFAVVYGQQQATFSAVLAVIGSHFIQLQDRSFLNIAMDYNTYIWIAQLFVVGLVVGYLKDQIKKLGMESREEQHFLRRQLSDIRDINGSNIRVKDALETEIINQRDSVGKIYEITQRLDQYLPEEVLFYAAEMMEEILGSNDIAIYTVSNNYYARLFVFTSEQAKSLGKSLRYRELGEIYDAMMGQRVYINRDLDNHLPMMANAIFDGDDIQTIIMVWGLPWERMTLGQADKLMIVSHLIQNAVLRATRYITMLDNQRFLDDGRVMEKEAFTSLVNIFMAARNKQLTDCALLRVDLPEKVSSAHVKTVQMPARASAPAPARANELPPVKAEPTPLKAEPTPVKAEPAPVKESAPTPVKKSEQGQKTSMLSALSGKLSIFGLNRGKGGAHAASTGAGQKALSAVQKPAPAESKPVPAEPKPAPAEPKPAPAEPKPVPVEPKPVPVEPKPAPETPEIVQVHEEENAEMTAQIRGLVALIRQDDYIGTLEDGNLYILLSNSSNTDAEFVVKRICNAGYQCVLLEDFNL